MPAGGSFREWLILFLKRLAFEEKHGKRTSFEKSLTLNSSFNPSKGGNFSLYSGWFRSVIVDLFEAVFEAVAKA